MSQRSPPPSPPKQTSRSRPESSRSRPEGSSKTPEKPNPKSTQVTATTPRQPTRDTRPS